VASFVGRQNELAFLHDQWEAVRGGCGGTILVRGEAGIGKSRLIRRFVVARGGRKKGGLLTISASPFHIDEPLWAVKTAMRLLLEIGVGDRSEVRRRLKHILFGDSSSFTQELSEYTLDDLLGLAEGPEPARLRNVSPSRLKELTLDTLISAAMRIARSRPLLLVVEDAQWLDPTSMELLIRLVDVAPHSRIMVLLSAREHFSFPEVRIKPQITELGGLSEADAGRILIEICGSRITPRVRQELIDRTGGIPLFLEEFARSIARSEASEMLATPATLHECLAAKLDRAGSAKAIAQAAAVLGVDGLHVASLSAIVGAPEPVIQEALAHLETVGLMECRRVPSAESWSFRHVLLRETAYDSMLRDHRQFLHGKVADVLAADAEPAILAHHLTAAGRVAESIPQYLNAARRSLAQSALQEAISLLRRGLAILESLPPTDTRQKQRLELMALLGPALIGLYGPGAQVTQDLYANAVAIAHELPDWDEHFPIFWGWWRLSHLQDFNESRERAAWLYREVRRRGDRGLLLQAHHSSWAALHNQGDLAGSARHIRAGLALYRVDEHREHASLYGNHDAKVCAHAHLALGLWQRGLAHAAEAEEGQSLAWAEHLGHVGSILHALEFALIHRAYRHQVLEVRAVADRLYRLADEYGYGHYCTRCRIFQGWAMAIQEDATKGAKLAAEALVSERDVNTADDFAVFHCLVAEAWMAAGEPERALADLVSARAGFELIGLHHWLPEIWRMIGDLTIALDPQNLIGAVRAYVKARRLAERQGAHRLALRATVRLERMSSWPSRQRSATRLARARERVSELEETADELIALSNFNAVERR
jgi:predicted ATPase